MTQEEIDALPDEMTITFLKPIEFATKTYTEVTIREPTAVQLEEITRHPGVLSTEIAIMQCGGLPLGVAKQMRARDIKKAEAFFTAFLEYGTPAS